MLVLDTGIQVLSEWIKDWIAGSKPAPDPIRGPAMTTWRTTLLEWNLL